MREDLGLPAPPGLDRPEPQLLAQQRAAQRRQERHQRRGLRDAGAQRVRDRDLPVARRLQQPGHAQQRLGPQLQRIAVVVVEAAQDHVHRVQPAQRLEEHAPVAHGQIAALDQRVAEVLRQERLLEVGRVVRAGGQQHDARVLAAVRRQRRQRVAQRPEERRQPLRVALAERLGQHAPEHDPVLQRVAGARPAPGSDRPARAGPPRACAPDRRRRNAETARRAARSRRRRAGGPGARAPPPAAAAPPRSPAAARRCRRAADRAASPAAPARRPAPRTRRAPAAPAPDPAARAGPDRARHRRR